MHCSMLWSRGYKKEKLVLLDVKLLLLPAGWQVVVGPDRRGRAAVVCEGGRGAGGKGKVVGTKKN